MRQALILLLFITSVAVAGEPAAPSLKADLDEIVAQGAVAPVNGISSAAQPDEAAFKVFADNGYVAVVDLRTAGEDRGLDEAGVVEGLGMEYVAFPISRKDINLEKAAEFDKLLAQYDEPVLVHCAGANRAAAMLALREYLDSGDSEKAMAVAKDGGITNLDDRVRELVEAETATE